MMQLFIEPMDVWLFRDGKPFDAQSDHRARSLFPPYPSVMQGVIRSQHLVLNKGNVDLTDQTAITAFIGDDKDYKGLRLRGPFIAKKNQTNGEVMRYYPIPADASPSAGGYKALHPKSRVSVSKVITSAPEELEMLFWPAGKPSKKELGEWMTEQELLKCLGEETATAEKTSRLFAYENHFGIGRDDATRTTKRQFLYEVDFIRPCKNVGLYVEVDGYNGWAERGVMRIGGEGRGAAYEIIGAPALPSLAQKFPEGKLPTRFKIYFATPTYFKNGWLPESWSKFFDGEVKLVAAAVNRYESVGGFDWTKKPADAQKPARRYVPAGSVYYFESNGTAKLKNDVLEMNAIADEGAQIGFGQIFIQEVNHV